jgi:hypothetical protein
MREVRDADELGSADYWAGERLLVRVRMRKFYLFTVQGVGRFPLDMLRHARCWPQGEADVCAAGTDGLRKVTLVSPYKPRSERWRSFGWSLVECRRTES